MAKKSTDLLYFCQFELIDKKTENIILEIDYINNILSKYLSGVKFASILFSELATVQTDGELSILLKHNNLSFSPLYFFFIFFY